MTRRELVNLAAVHVLDGGMASEMEFLGADISGPLWSAHVLEDRPELVKAVHRGYLAAGADVLLTASYQVSRKGYREFGLEAARADRALMQAVELAVETRAEFEAGSLKADTFKAKPMLIAASLGPYGAALHDGSEYHGNYDCSFEDLVDFHRKRIVVLVESEADLLAFETLPSIEEARAIGVALEPWPEVAAWFTFTCPTGRGEQLQVAHGELLRDCARLVAGFPQAVAVGVNCTGPEWIEGLIGELKAASEMPVVVYPNSGEGWDAQRRCWTGMSDPAEFGKLAEGWFRAGAGIVGGCCRTRPEHIRRVAAAYDAVSDSAG